MKRFHILQCIVGLLLLSKDDLTAQKTVILHDSLMAHADVLEVDIKSVAGRNREFTLGKYSIFADEQWSGTESKTKEKLTSEGTSTSITNYFSFTISNGVDSAEVYMEEKSRMKTSYPFAESENSSFVKMTSTKLISHAAWITINRDTSTTWTLYVPEKKKNEFYFKRLLSDGVSYMNVSPVSSDPDFNYAHPFRSARKMPAMGAEFMDEGKSICAVQFTSGEKDNYATEEDRSHGCMAWMHQDLDERTKLILAAAVATLILEQSPYLGIHQD